jgi:signal transduction histidine kinase
MGIVRDIVEAHEGTIDVTSDVGVGTVVALRFPPHRVKDTAP